MYILVSAIQAVTIAPFLKKTETIWLPSLMHGATNAFTVFAYLAKPEYADKAILGPAAIGIISMIPMIIMAVIICIKQKKIEY